MFPMFQTQMLHGPSLDDVQLPEALEVHLSFHEATSCETVTKGEFPQGSKQRQSNKAKKYYVVGRRLRT